MLNQNNRFLSYMLHNWFLAATVSSWFFLVLKGYFLDLLIPQHLSGTLVIYMLALSRPHFLSDLDTLERARIEINV